MSAPASPNMMVVFHARKQKHSRFKHCVVEWLMRHPVQSKPGVCLGCGRGDEQAGIVLPFGTEANGHAWLHAACWPDWFARRRAEAVTALAAMNIGK